MKLSANRKLGKYCLILAASDENKDNAVFREQPSTDEVGTTGFVTMEGLIAARTGVVEVASRLSDLLKRLRRV